MMSRHAICRCLLGLTVLLTCATTTPCEAKDWSPTRFDREIAPILASRCLECHSGPQPQGGLRLDVQESALRGGDSGSGVVAGQLEQSLVWKRMVSGEMPPENPLPAAERTLIRDWIAGGAVWGASPIDPLRYSTTKRAGYDWWSLQPMKRPKVPQVPGNLHAIDRFVHTRLQEQGLTPSPRASPRVIIRRLSFDLLGLPPSPEAVRRFETGMRHSAETALNQLVSQYLASRHYGERWARHWLDVVRFGESQGFERDKLRENSWYYRDWIINALCNDMPYDEFVRLQIAGDVLHPEDPAAIT